jgi:hypothetical protein
MNLHVVDPWKDAQVYINDVRVAKDAPILLLRGRPNRVRLVVPDLVGGTISLEALDKEGLNLQANPTFGSWVLLDDDAEWELNQADAKSGHLTLVVLSRDVNSTLELACWVMSENLEDEVDQVLVEGSVPAGGILFFRDQPQTITVTYKPLSPLYDYPVQLLGAPLTGVTPDNLVVTSTGVHQWSVHAHTNSGTFRLALEGLDMTGTITLPDSTVISSDLNDEVLLLLDNVPIPASGVDFIGGKSKTLTLRYLNADVMKHLPLAVDAILETVLLPGDITGDPALCELTATHEWSITGANKTGTFRLRLYGEQQKAELISPILRIELKAPDVSFTFVEQVGNAPLPIPPDEYLFPVNFLTRPCALMLKDAAGRPLRDVPITVTQPEMPDFSYKTNAEGKMSSPVANIGFEVGFRFKVVATAKLDDGDATAELWVRIVSAGQP